jgi:hypothetical protein
MEIGYKHGRWVEVSYDSIKRVSWHLPSRTFGFCSISLVVGSVTIISWVYFALNIFLYVFFISLHTSKLIGYSKILIVDIPVSLH